VDAIGVEAVLLYGGWHGMVKLGKRQPESWGDALWYFICIRKRRAVGKMSQRKSVDLEASRAS
jgi:hypothetical protein